MFEDWKCYICGKDAYHAQHGSGITEFKLCNKHYHKIFQFKDNGDLLEKLKSLERKEKLEKLLS